MECKQNGKYTTFHISKLYDIIDIYNKSFTIEHSDHKKCLCNALFCSEITLNNGVNTLDKYICEHFEKIDIINKIYSKLFLKYPKISWNINHQVNYNGNSEYNLYKKFKLIGYDDNNVINQNKNNKKNEQNKQNEKNLQNGRDKQIELNELNEKNECDEHDIINNLKNIEIIPNHNLKLLTIIATHTNSFLKYNLIKSNLKYFNFSFNKIIIINSSNLFFNKELEKYYNENNILYYECENSEKTIDFGKWIYILKKNLHQDFDKILFTNDSY
jgi:hypothetical protein